MYLNLCLKVHGHSDDDVCERVMVTLNLKGFETEQMKWEH